MTFKQVVRELCRREGKRQGVNVAQMSEIVRCLSDMLNDPKLDRYGIMIAIEGYKLEKLFDSLKKQGPKDKPRRKKGKRND